MEKYQWIKLDVDVFNNRKIKKIESEEDGQLMVLIWIKLLVLSAQIKDNGQVYITKNVGYSPKELANELGYFGRKLEKIIEKSLKLFQNLEMIENDNGIITINNWHRYQDYEKEENTRKYNAERQRKYRESKLNVSKANHTNNCDITVMKQLSNALDKEVDVDVEEEIEKELEEDTHFVRKEESEQANSSKLLSLPKPLVVNTTDYRQAPRIAELTQDAGMPYGWFIGKEQRIIDLGYEDYQAFKSWLIENQNEISSFSIKKKLIEITTGEIVV